MVTDLVMKQVIGEELEKIIRDLLQRILLRREKEMARILIIDDEIQVRNMLRQTFENEGFEVVEASDGKEGVKLFHQKKPDVIITDILMPEKEGLETIMELCSEHPGIKIIAMSGGSSYFDPGNFLIGAREFGACRCFTKPFDRNEILKAVQEVLETE